MRRRVVRSGAIALVVAASIVVLAVWVASNPAASPHHAAPQATQRAGTADEVAIAEANRLLASAVLPSDARRISASSASDLTAVVGPSCSPKIERSRFVVVPFSTPSAVRDFVVQHLTRGLQLTDMGGASMTGAGTHFIVSQDDGFGDQLYFTIAPGPHGGADIRIDAIVLEPQGMCTFNAVAVKPSPSSTTPS
jgi:hypothetical protein